MGIAHNRCLDLLRRRKVRIGIEGDSSAAPEPAAAPESHARLHVPAALERLVLKLPPKERACMLLKEVFEYSLEETAAVVGSTLGGVKAALHRGRAKLVDTREAERPSRPPSAEDLRVLHLYVERFNQRDWNGVLELTRADARLDVADAYKGPFTESSGYFSNYQRATIPWRLAVGFVDGEPVVLTLRETRDEQWTPASATRISLRDRHIAEIRDYGHCPWVLSAATSVEVSTSH
jgi:RNA polymerase sigma-70 factor (ECF subfamily)